MALINRAEVHNPESWESTFFMPFVPSFDSKVYKAKNCESRVTLQSEWQQLFACTMAFKRVPVMMNGHREVNTSGEVKAPLQPRQLRNGFDGASTFVRHLVWND